MRAFVVCAVTLGLAALALAGCGGGAESAQPLEDAKPEHIHGVGVDPGDGAVLVATHRGLFRAARGADRLRPVGTYRHDLMGFTVVGAGDYVASGHPDLRTDLPSHLGLIRSRDGGRTWQPVSLHGHADFHLLRARGDVLYGGDVRGGRFLRSDDGGTTWEERTLPAPTSDVAVSPADEDRLVAATERGLYASEDGARSWRRLRAGIGFVAWPAEELLVVVAPDGSVSRSRDGGRTLQSGGSLDGQPEALAAADGAVVAAVHGRGVFVSRDGGATWTLRAR
ncbi:MAG TPA: hypothetical protein VNT58_05305 [Gaiellaceae bacterium]|nr:hypothetical protein [Gaiellaceae bacterium]